MPRLTHRTILFILVALASPRSATAEATERPNILFILADDVGQEVLGSYGGLSYGTPRLDRLAREGMRFEHCYSMPVCHPSRLTLLSGRYPFRFDDAPWGSFPKEAEGQTVAHTLRRAGYRTAVAGKWQLTLLGKDPEHPHRLGFDEYSLFGWHEGARYYEPHIRQNGQLRTDVRERYGPDVYCEFLIEFMKRHRTTPFFAFYSMALCHDVTDDLETPVPLGPHGRYDSYREMAEAMDERVGRLLDALQQLRIAERTLVIFTTDNGTARRSIITARDGKLFREPVSSLRGKEVVPGGKGRLTDGGTRVPLIARWPGTIRAGAVSDQLVDFSDFLPTLAAVAGAALPDTPRLDGRSFLPTLTEVSVQGQGSARRWAFSQSKDSSWVRTQRWKLYRDGRFYDVGRDPTEARESDKSSAPALRELQAALDALYAPQSR